MQLRIADAELFLDTCRTRLPFRFGMHTLTQAPLALLRLTVEAAGRTVHGCSSDLLVPKWFEKSPDLTPAQDVQRLVDSARRAVGAAIGTDGTAFDCWHRVWTAATEDIHPHAGDRLVHGYGASLLERACIDAACRAANLPFHEALRGEVLGLDLARLDPDAGDWSPTELALPRRTVTLRHTVGLLDALRERDLPEADRVGDGLPETLEGDIEANGLTCFKLKCSGDIDADVDRLLATASLLRSHAGEKTRITIDGNEQFSDIEGVRMLMDRVTSHEQGAWLCGRLLLIEQPLPRTATFEPDRNRGIERLGVPVIIDEADGDIGSLPEAAALGHGGVSVKNCKGVFRALLNRARCDRSGGALMQSAEDLTNLPVIALQQDLCTISTLGIDHVERNGHHYFRGLDHLPVSDAADARAHHGDLYGEDGLHIDAGELHIGSLHGPGYGYAPPPSCDARTKAADWTWPDP